MIVLNVEQRSDEWFAARRGIPTASNFKKIITATGKRSTQRKDYMYQLAAEKLTGIKEEGFTSKAMDEGTEREEECKWVYAMKKGVYVREVGIILSDDRRYGASPDGLVGDKGSIEMKNPKGKTAVKYLMANKVPSEYFQQVQGQLYVSEREWCDFISYYPGLPMFIVRVFPDDVFIKQLKKELVAFCDELDIICSTIEKKRELEL